MPRDKKASSSGDDLISALPDGVLRHVLGFLPADEAVRTTVLAPRWRGLWRSTRRLRIINSEERWKSAQDFNKFVNRLFLLRDPNCALDQIDFSDHSFWGRDGTDINIWIRHALLCRATVLSARFGDRFFHDTVDGPALASRHLKKLGLAYMTLKGNFLDLSSCPALEDLNITNSDLGTHKILSQSVKRLSIKNCTITAKMHISVPSLVWLHLHFIGPLSPSLESMPSLETALVSSIIGRNLQIDQYNHLFLGGRWTATRWVLTSKYGLDFIKNQPFNRDLRWCPTLSKLKTLLLHELLFAIDFLALACILEHSPVLEKLTLQLAKESERIVELEGCYDATEQLSAISEHLNIIEIKCEQVNGRVCQILRFLGRFGRQINIIPGIRCSTFWD